MQEDIEKPGSAAHTPGPWRWVGTHGEQFDGYVVADGALDGLALPIAQMCWRDVTANARLIAAAPELLEACKCALSTGMLEHGGVADILRAAIAKATGGAA